MSTVTISLPEQIAQKVDAEIKAKGYATRSEFIRSLVRRYFAKEDLIFEEFSKEPLHEIRAQFEKTGKYKKEFVDSLVKGLSESSLYASKTNKGS